MSVPTEHNFNKDQALKDGNLVKGLIWLGENDFKWCKCSVIAGPNQHGQYVLQRLFNGWYATTDRLRNLKPEEKKQILNS